MAEIDSQLKNKNLRGNPAWGSRANGTGKTGNANGGPRKDVCLTSLLKQYLLEVPDLKIGGQTNTKTWRELIAQAWLVGAYKGNSVLFKELLERVDGKVVQPIGGEGGGPVQIRATISVVSTEAKTMLGDVLAGKGTEARKANGE